MKKLYIWTTEYDVLLALAETLEEAKKELYYVYSDTLCDSGNAGNIDGFDIGDRMEDILIKDPIILESGAMILYHANE